MSDGDSSTFAKMSEHAIGNAVDILALGLADKRQIGISAVANELNPDHRLLMALRLTACGYFTTVLGAGANTTHANHYHLGSWRSWHERKLSHLRIGFCCGAILYHPAEPTIATGMRRFGYD
jgi:hypothetical protein